MTSSITFISWPYLYNIIHESEYPFCIKEVSPVFFEPGVKILVCPLYVKLVHLFKLICVLPSVKFSILFALIFVLNTIFMFLIKNV